MFISALLLLPLLLPPCVYGPCRLCPSTVFPSACLPTFFFGFVTFLYTSNLLHRPTLRIRILVPAALYQRPCRLHFRLLLNAKRLLRQNVAQVSTTAKAI
mmetsp:Transcript_21468/g.30716  ORF Transcript_21468/g.30716 Transcript_21468/m.30716 type:complete len:100 (+) Transcript_21468:150-449(+)